MFAPILAALAGEGAQLLNMTYQDYLNDGNMAAANQMNQQNQREAGLNHVFSLKNAGLSPALANNGNFSPVQTSPLAAGLAQAPNMFEAAQIAQNQKLVDSQSNLLDAQAENVSFDIGEKYGERLTLNSLARSFMVDEIKSGSKWSAAYQKILADNSAITGGTMRAISYWQNFLNTNDLGKAQAIANSFVNEVYRLKLNNGAAKILSTLPHRDLQRFAMDLTLDNARVGNILSSTDVNKSTLPHLAADTYRLLTEADARYHKDFAAMWQKSDFSALAASLFASALQSAATGAGLYFGAKGVSFGARAATGHLAPTTKKGFDTLFKTGFEGKRLGKKTSPLESLSQSEQNRKILSYY